MMPERNIGAPGWAGRTVTIRALDPAGNDTVRARAWLTASGAVACDDAVLLSSWETQGIVGRADRGQLFPKDGQAFLDELPFMYKSAYLRAEPSVDEADEG